MSRPVALPRFMPPWRPCKPVDEIEGMIAGQMVAMHFAAMTCFRKANLGDQPAEIASKQRRDGANLSRGMMDMLEALNRHRGKCPQVVRVERVVVHEGGRAIVGNIRAGAGPATDNGDPPWEGGGMTEKRGMNPMNPLSGRLPDWRAMLVLARSCPRCGAKTRRGTPCQSPAMKNKRRCLRHGGKSKGPTTDAGLLRSKRARLTHGAYGAEARAWRALLGALGRERRRVRGNGGVTEMAQPACRNVEAETKAGEIRLCERNAAAGKQKRVQGKPA